MPYVIVIGQMGNYENPRSEHKIIHYIYIYIMNSFTYILYIMTKYQPTISYQSECDTAEYQRTIVEIMSSNNFRVMS